MFTVKKVTTFERYCPDGHDLLPETNHAERFCHVCGTSVEERRVRYDAAYCFNCNSRVDPAWNCCPHCGQGR
ncbi:hypothetical protein LCGC14_1630940 [marine sediment metagenome]|uniref:DZANK-type domain-containing protein n=1 Tax=marine sediment metagenome TaxID=412755 RepID=A0A0F9KI75_9ZZZZ